MKAKFFNKKVNTFTTQSLALSLWTFVIISAPIMLNSVKFIHTPFLIYYILLVISPSSSKRFLNFFYLANFYYYHYYSIQVASTSGSLILPWKPRWWQKCSTNFTQKFLFVYVPLLLVVIIPLWQNHVISVCTVIT